MELTISYLLKSAIVLLVLYLFYYALLRNQNNFSFNRLYLLLAPLVAMVLPLLKWPAALAPESAVGEVLQTIQLSEVTVTAFGAKGTAASAPALSLTTIAYLVYGLGALVVLLKLLKQLWQVKQVKAIAAASNTTMEDVPVFELPAHYPTFSFGKAIFLSKPNHMSPEDESKVLAHELAHVKLYHTWDVVYFELLSAVLWLNPVVWLLKQELRDVHEYQADVKVLHSYQVQEYSALLSREVLQNMGLPIGSYFQKPQVLKRLAMLQRNERRAGWLRPLLVLPLVSGLVFVFSTHEVDAKTVLSDALAAVSDDSAEEKTDQQPIALEAKPTEEGKPEKINKVPEPAVTKPEPAPNRVADAEQPKVAPEKAEDPIAEVLEEKPYAYVEHMPQFEGGETEMLKYLAKNIRYPKAAQDAGKEGLVVVSFVVNQSGALSNYRVIKSLDESTDAEALRVVKSMNGKWSPGTQNGRPVPVRYTLPVRFAIKN